MAIEETTYSPFVIQRGIVEEFGNHFQGVYSDNNTPAHDMTHDIADSICSIT